MKICWIGIAWIRPSILSGIPFINRERRPWDFKLSIFYLKCQVFFNLLLELTHLLFLSKKSLNLLFFLSFLELILFTSIERCRLHSLSFWWYLSNNCLKYLFPHHLIRYFLKLWQIGVSIRPIRFRSRFLFRTHFKLFLCQLSLSEAFTWFMAWLKVEIIIICALSLSTLI